MHLTIKLDGNDVKVILKEGRKKIDQVSWTGEHSLSERLLASIDLLLERNGVVRSRIEKIVPAISKVSGVTSSRIVQTVAKAWQVAMKYQEE
ncbi:MAG TPA: hypothetical protein PKA31_02360 [Candidatus Moranbacteria bacterium]|nr:hypothetical protein [Candidatus Moranbacteria bacterium]